MSLSIQKAGMLLPVGEPFAGLGFDDSYTPEEFVVADWGNGPGEIGYRPSGPERRAAGPSALTVDNLGRVYLLDSVNNRVVMFDSAGVFSDEIALEDSVGAVDLAVSPSGIDVFVLDSTNERLLKYNRKATLLGEMRATGVISQSTKVEMAMGAVVVLEGIKGHEAHAPEMVTLTVGRTSEALPGDIGLLETRPGRATRQGPHSFDLRILADTNGLLTIAQTDEATAHTCPITTANPLAGAALLDFDAAGNAYVRVDTFAASGSSQLSIESAVFKIRADGSLVTTFPLPSEYHTLPYQALEVDASGRVYLLLPGHDKVRVIRWTQHDPESAWLATSLAEANRRDGGKTVPGLGHPEYVGKGSRAISPRLSISRDAIIANAEQYRWHSWNASSANLYARTCPNGVPVGNSPWSVGGHTGVAYAWGGYDSIGDYDWKLANGYFVGDIATVQVADCVAGVDCSGFVSRAWGESRYTTRTIDQISYEISSSDLQPGDILNKPGQHVVLFSYWDGGGQPVYYEATNNSPYKVWLNTYSGWSGVSGYTPRRYNGISSGDTHLECRSNQCVRISGSGSDQCSPEGSWCGSCPQSGGVILYWNNLYNCDNGEGDTGYRQRTSTGGENISGAFNEKASSVKVPSGWSVMLYKDPGWGGSSRCRTSDDSDFSGDTFLDGTGLNDAISSFEAYDNTYCAKAPVNFSEHHHYTGSYYWADHEACFGMPSGFGASSLRLWPGWSVRVFKGSGCTGTSKCFTSNDSDFANNTFEDGSQLNDQISSFRLCHNTSCCIPASTPSSPSPSDGATGVSISADLDWANAANATSYDVYFGTSSSPPYYGNTSSSSYALPTLSYGTHYYWKIVAKNSCGQTTTGPVWDFTTQCLAPGTPGSPSPSDNATGVSINADLDWANAANATSYDVYFGTSSSPPYYSNTSSSNYNLPTLSYGTHYYWKIAAKNSCGQTATGPVWDFTTGCLAPGTPGSPSPSDNATGVSVNADLDWANAANATSYDVYFGTSSSPPYYGNTSSSSYTLPALSYHTHYYWKIVARNACGQTTTGPLWDFTTQCGTPGTPGSPSPADDATGVSISADLDWANAANATSYDVYFGTSSSPPLYGSTSSSSYSLPSLSYSTHYYWRIVAKNACAETATGPIWDFTTQCLAPGTPGGPSPSDNATGVSVNADLDWANAANATSYDVYFGTTSSPPYYSNTSSSSYNLPTLDYDEQYYWRIVARNDCGQTTSGPIWDFTTQCLAPGTPGSPSPPAGATGTSIVADLDWADVSNATSYDVYFGTAPNPPYYGNTSSSSYALPTLSYYTHYHWKIAAKNACGSTAGPTWDFTTQCLAPTTPSSPSPSDSATEVSINADLDWALVASATVYDVYFGTSSSPPYLGSSSSDSYTLPTLSFDTPYHWKVVAKNACGEAAASPVWSFRTSEARLILVPLAMRDFARNSPPPAPTPTPCPAPPIEDLSFDPSPPVSVGTTVNVHAKATWNTCFRAMRLRIDGQVVYELGAPEFTWDWNTLGYASGDHVVRLECAGQGDDTWSNPSTRESTYRLAAGPSLYVMTGDGIVEVSPEGVKKTIVAAHGESRSIELLDDELYVSDQTRGGDIWVYDRQGNHLRTISTPPEAEQYLKFVTLPDGRIALLDNDTDRVYFVDSSGNLLATTDMLDAPDASAQNLDGVVVGDRLILSEDGDNRILQFDLTSYERTVFKDLSSLPHWLGAIDYDGELYYICGPSEVYFFPEAGDAIKIAEIPEGNITGIAVAGDLAYLTVNFSGRIYEVDLTNGGVSVLASGFNYPRDLEYSGSTSVSSAPPRSPAPTATPTRLELATPTASATATSTETQTLHTTPTLVATKTVTYTATPRDIATPIPTEAPTPCATQEEVPP